MPKAQIQNHKFFLFFVGALRHYRGLESWTFRSDLLDCGLLIGVGMADKVKLSKDGSSIDFVQSDNVPTSVKKFRQSPEIEGFYRFIYENDLQREAYKVLERIISERKQKKTFEKQTEKVSVSDKTERMDRTSEVIERTKPSIDSKSEQKSSEKPAAKPATKIAHDSKAEAKSDTKSAMKQQAKAPPPPAPKKAAAPPPQAKGKPAPAKGKAPPPKVAAKKKK